MGWIFRFYESSLGLKYVMAITGIGLYGFLIGHLGGNLLIFFGPEALNEYAAGLQRLPLNLLWIIRFGLLSIFVLHVVTAIRLSIKNKAARPERYHHEKTLQATLASKTMIHTGVLVLVFVCYHLAHFTFRAVQDTGQAYDIMGRPDVYRMVVEGFSQPIIVGIYIVSMIILGFHLSHGLSSMFQSLGINHPKYNGLIKWIGPVFGGGIALCNIFIPLSVFFGLVS